MHSQSPMGRENRKNGKLCVVYELDIRMQRTTSRKQRAELPQGKRQPTARRTVCERHSYYTQNYFFAKMPICPLKHAYTTDCQHIVQVGISVALPILSGHFLQKAPIASFTPALFRGMDGAIIPRWIGNQFKEVGG